MKINKDVLQYIDRKDKNCGSLAWCEIGCQAFYLTWSYITVVQQITNIHCFY